MPLSSISIVLFTNDCNKFIRKKIKIDIMKVASFLKDLKFSDNKPVVSLLLDTDFSKEIRVVFKKGQIMEDHQAPFAIIVQVVKGCIDFGVNEEVKTIKYRRFNFIKTTSSS